MALNECRKKLSSSPSRRDHSVLRDRSEEETASVLRQIIFGVAVSLGNIAIHATAMLVILQAREAVHAIAPAHPILRLVGIMSAAVSMLMGAHLLEIAAWSISYRLVDVVPSDTFYFAFVNYTTLGYGDIVPVVRWRLLGPMTAMNGVLLFGWSTAVIFQILWATLPRTELQKQ